MVTRVIHLEMPNKNQILSMATRWLLVTIKHSQALVIERARLLNRVTLISHAHSFQFMEWHNLGITTLKDSICFPNLFQKLQQNQITTNFIYVTSYNFVIKYLQTTLITDEGVVRLRIYVRYCSFSPKRLVNSEWINKIKLINKITWIWVLNMSNWNV